ncbi:MAG TPA: PLP-dependent aminotransferase family protein [Opitutaceae bacterium]|nr:PLP-dependent aminotransferase family protein [Opitutaceae bacterium]
MSNTAHVSLFSRRTQRMKRSVIREILKVTDDPEIISFAGGLPNPRSFPVAEVAESTAKVLREAGTAALQYATTEGYRPLREFIARRYAEKRGLAIDPDEILITNGSQQGLDLLGKVVLDAGDPLLLERPAYLGAIQAFSPYEPDFCSVTLEDDGPNLAELERVLGEKRPKLFYTVPNFQNPSGLSYSAAKRAAVARLCAARPMLLVEDDPYGELRFRGEHLPSLRHYHPGTILLGTFSKIVAPGLRLGWIVAPPPVMDLLVTAKQGVDLHSNYFAQRVVHQHLVDHDLDAHIEKVRELYGRQRDAMVAAIRRYFPADVKSSEPDGGMFLWVRLPEGVSAMALFNAAIARKVAFVPGSAFFVEPDDRHLRLNFSNSDEAQIEEGMRRLGATMSELLARR